MPLLRYLKGKAPIMACEWEESRNTEKFWSRKKREKVYPCRESNPGSQVI
jgi:hypothetical protein